MNIFILVIFFAFLLFVLPIRTELLLNVKLKDKKVEFEPICGMNNILKVKAMFFIPVISKNIFDEKKREKKKNRFQRINKKQLILALYNSIKFQELIVSLGVNVHNPVVNSYINASLNTGLCMYINKNIKKFNFNNLYYQIYLSDLPLVLSVNTKIDIAPIKFILEYIKQKINAKNSKGNKDAQNVA